MQFLAKVSITPKPTINDPQGNAVLAALKNLGFQDVNQVHVGKYLELSFEALNRDEAETQLAQMCNQLLANPVIEQFRCKLEEYNVTNSVAH